MRRLTTLRLAALPFFLAAFTAYRGQAVTAEGVIECDNFWPVGTYYGEEVECAVPGQMCDAVCDYCFGWACSYVYQCQAGSHFTVVCQSD